MDEIAAVLMRADIAERAADEVWADFDCSHGSLGSRAATVTSLIILGVPEARATALVDGRQ